MNDSLLIDAFRRIPRDQVIRVPVHVGKLRKVCSDRQSLEPFLAESLTILLRLFHARAGAFWFRPFNAATLCPVSRIGFDQLPLSSQRLLACEQQVRGAWQAVEPQIKPIDQPLISLIGPIRDGNTAIGALQLFAEYTGTDQAEVKPLYAQALAMTLALLQPAIRQRMQVGETSISEATQRLSRLAEQLLGLQQSMRQTIEQTLGQLQGASFGSLDANQRFTRTISELLDSHGLRVACSQCGQAAIVRCSKNPRTRDGVFVFDHIVSGRRTFHGGTTTLPLLRVVDKPRRRNPASLNVESQ